MGWLNIFAPALQTATLQPSALLPSACVFITTIPFPAITSISNSTLTYTGLPNESLFTPIALKTTTYTTVVTTRGLDGVVEVQTYTILGAPVEVTASSPPYSTPSDSSVSSPISTTFLISTPVTSATAESRPSSVVSEVSQTSAQPLVLSTYIALNPFIGCVADRSSNGQPLLYGPTTRTDTQESCKDFCTTSPGGPYKYFGMKDGSDCHCGNTFLHSTVDYPGECSLGCPGNSTQQCGGSSNRMSLWQNSAWPPKFEHAPSPGPVYSGVGPLFDYPPSSPGDGVDDDPWDTTSYPWRFGPQLPPPGVNSPPSAPGDGVDDGMWDAKPHPKPHPIPHSKPYPKPHPEPHPEPYPEHHSARPNSNPVPEYRPKPQAPPPLDDSSYDPYISLAYPVNTI